MNTPETPQAGRLLRPTHPAVDTNEVALPFIEDAQPPPPPIQEPAAAVGIFIHAVAQVFNQASPFYGVLFIIGDIRAGKVHGFHMLAGGRKEFVTVDVGECFPIGVSKARSKDPCSQQWKTEHKIP